MFYINNFNNCIMEWYLTNKSRIARSKFKWLIVEMLLVIYRKLANLYRSINQSCSKNQHRHYWFRYMGNYERKRKFQSKNRVHLMILLRLLLTRVMFSEFSLTVHIRSRVRSASYSNVLITFYATFCINTRYFYELVWTLTVDIIKYKFSFTQVFVSWDCTRLSKYTMSLFYSPLYVPNYRKTQI